MDDGYSNITKHIIIYGFLEDRERLTDMFEEFITKGLAVVLNLIPADPVDADFIGELLVGKIVSGLDMF